MTNFIETFTKLFEEVQAGPQSKWQVRNTTDGVWRGFEKDNPVAVTGPMTQDQAHEWKKNKDAGH